MGSHSFFLSSSLLGLLSLLSQELLQTEQALLSHAWRKPRAGQSRWVESGQLAQQKDMGPCSQSFTAIMLSFSHRFWGIELMLLCLASKHFTD